MTTLWSWAPGRERIGPRARLTWLKWALGASSRIIPDGVAFFEEGSLVSLRQYGRLRLTSLT